MKTTIFYISERDEGMRLDLYISNQYQDLSRSYIQKLIKRKLVKVNEKYQKNNYIVKDGDEVEVVMPPVEDFQPKPQKISLDIIYEDEDIIIINKARDMVVHPAPGNYDNTLVNALLYHSNDNLSSINGAMRRGIVHRIDKDTSGLLMVAKTNTAHRFLAHQLKEYSVIRRYHAITLGLIKQNNFVINAPIARHPTHRIKMAVVDNGRDASTRINILERFREFSYVEAELQTGRTHQIRVHLSHIKHPVLGDETYGGKTKKFNLQGQVLHAKILGFIHPTTKEYMEFEAPLPSDFEKILKTLRDEMRKY